MVKTKRILSLLLAMVMVLGLGMTAFAEEVTPISAPEDTVVSTEVDAKIQALVDAGLVQGDEGGLRLDQPITRAEVSAMLVRALDEEALAGVMKSINSSFRDLTTNHWANGYVNLMSGKGVVAGYPDGTFAPDANITYNEVLTMLVRTVSPLTAQEEASGKWPTKYLLKASALGLLKEVEIDDFKAVATRDKVFETIFNAVELLGDKLVVGNAVEVLVIENNRVGGTSADEVLAVVLKDQAKKEDEREYAKGDTITLKLTEELKKLGDAESLLGKALLLSVDAKGEVVKVALNSNYTQVQGKVEDIEAGRIKVDGKWYTVREDKDKSDSLTVAYLNSDEELFDKENSNNDFLGKVLAGNVDEFVRLTVKSGNVVFIDAFDFKDVAYVTKDVDAKFTLEFANDLYDGVSTKLFDLNKARVIKFEGNDLKVSTHTAIKAGDVIQWFNTADKELTVIVRPAADNKVTGKFKDISAKTVVGATKITLAIGSEDYEIVLNNTNRNPVYTTTTVEDFRTLTSDYVYELSVFEDQTITLAIDIFGNVQAIVSTTGGVSGYAIIEKVLGSEIKLFGADGKSNYYKITARDTDFLHADGTRANANSFNTNDLVRVKVAGDVVKELVLMNNTVEGIKTITRDVVEYTNDEFDYLANNVRIFDLSGRLPKLVLASEFKTNYDLTKTIKGFVAFADRGNNVEAIVITEATSKLNVDTTEKIAKVVDFRISGNNITIVLEDSKGEKTSHVVKSEEVVTALRNREIEADSVVKAFISKDKDLFVTDLEELVDQNAFVFEVANVDSRNGDITLRDKNNVTRTFKLARTASEFGRYTIGSLVAIGEVNEVYNTIDVIVERANAPRITGVFVIAPTADELAAQVAKDAIAAIPATVVLANEGLVIAARNAYDGLTPAQVALVTAPELTKLTDAEDRIIVLKQEAADALEIADAKVLLNDEITTSEELVVDEALYTVATWTPFATALADAKVVHADAEATLLEVTTATSVLTGARTDLVLE